ncbi:hypothetical protein ACLWBD_10775 [Bdellovibrio sp. HCB117]|uniref:hypothetical protein n=1 Tax=Bdellovibrio sp. HCB117 TaxID=3394359 RepID=UPI0039B63459
MTRYLIFLALLFPLTSVAQGNCFPSENSCDFYQCKEQERQCGAEGYWMNFGHPYCESFLKDQQQFYPRTQVWLKDVRLCLQERVQQVSQEASCNDLHKQAMHSHVSCYVDTGFCDLTYLERARVYWYLKGALRSASTWQEAALLHQACWNHKMQTYGWSDETLLKDAGL